VTDVKGGLQNTGIWREVFKVFRYVGMAETN
jgi:hypothetical protein